MFILHEDGGDGSFIDSLLENFNIIKIAMMIKAPFWFQDLFPSPSEHPKASPHFLVNTFGLFITFGIIIGNSLFLKILEKACKAKEWKVIKTMIKNLHSIIIFAAFVLFANSVTILPYFYILQFKTLILDNIWAYISFGVSIVFLLLYTIFICYIIYLINHIPTKGFRDYVKRWKYCEMLFAGFEEHSVFTRFFFVVYILVSLGSSTATSLFGEISISNGIIQLFLTIATFIYVLMTKPLKNVVNNYQLLLLQSLAVVKFVYVIWLTATKNVTKADHFIKLLNKIATLVLVLFLLVKLMKEMREIKRLLDQQPKRSKVIWINLFHVLIQQFGMGFEHSKVPKFYKEHVKEGDEEENNLSFQPTQYQQNEKPLLKNKYR